jgi:hypothetical protein
MQLKSDRALTIHADGEDIAGFRNAVKEVTVEVIPSAVELMI